MTYSTYLQPVLDPVRGLMLSVQITEHCGYHSGKGYCAVFRSVVLHVFLRIGVLVLMGPFCTLNKLPYLTLPYLVLSRSVLQWKQKSKRSKLLGRIVIYISHLLRT